MAARSLIVNADDYNSDEERTRGIWEAAEKGIVTSVSVIANLPFHVQSVSKLKTVFSPRIGVHLNITKGVPLTKGTTSLVDKSNQFFKKRNAWRRALLHQYNLKEVKDEFAAQISRSHALGITPDHLDGNNHLHVFPGIAEVVASLARDFNIKKIRMPLEKFQNPLHYFQPKAFKKYFFGLLARQASSVFKSFGLVFPEHFAGIQFPRVADIESLRNFFRNLPPGTTELMCHPGCRNVSMLLSSQSKHEEELAALTNPEVLAALKQEQITLISFHDLQGL